MTFMLPNDAEFLKRMIEREVTEQLAKLGQKVEIAIREQREHDETMNAIAAAHAAVTRPHRKGL